MRFFWYFIFRVSISYFSSSSPAPYYFSFLCCCCCCWDISVPFPFLLQSTARLGITTASAIADARAVFFSSTAYNHYDFQTYHYLLQLTLDPCRRITYEYSCSIPLLSLSPKLSFSYCLGNAECMHELLADKR